MFDIYSQSSTHTRSEAFTHPETQPTWMEMTRQSQLDDPEIHLRRTFTESPLSLFVAKFLAGFRSWQFPLAHRPARSARTHRQYLPLKHHSPLHH